MISVILTLMVTRGHYFIDTFIAVLFGHYFWMMAERVSWIVDFKLLSIPFHKRFPNFPKKCFKCKAPINKWTNIDTSLIGVE